MLNKSPTMTSTLQPIAQAAWLLCLSIAASTTHAQSTPAATLEFVQGAVSVRNAAGQERTAQRGTQVNNGETIETQNGRAQMRMVDGAFISLQNDTTLRLDNYRMTNANESESALMSLVRGGLRTVTGLIGRTNKSNYRLQTATATVGIRGTGFTATSGDEGTRVRVTEGLVALCTQGGCLDLASQQSGFASSAATPPIRISVAPVLNPAPAPTAVVIAPQTEQRLVSVRQELVSVAPPTAPPAAAPPPAAPPPAAPPPAAPPPAAPPPAAPPPAPPPPAAPPPSSAPRIPLTGLQSPIELVISAYDALDLPYISSSLGLTAQFDTQGRIKNFVIENSVIEVPPEIVTDFGSDGIVAWGRWADTSEMGVANYLHLSYVGGNRGAAVPIVGSYTVFGSTAPVALAVGSSVAQIGQSNSVTGNMSINFASSQGGTLNYDLSIPLSGQTFNMVGQASQYNGTSFLVTANNTSRITSTGSACSAGCAGALGESGDPRTPLFGTVFGVGNTRVGAQYGFTSGIGTVTGAVVLRK
jgi:hypothetical protein